MGITMSDGEREKCPFCSLLLAGPATLLAPLHLLLLLLLPLLHLLLVHLLLLLDLFGMRRSSRITVIRFAKAIIIRLVSASDAHLCYRD
ncbi:unnamed protein product [Protopolystoma xenopodis]|uniref:Uncharacterized protein n=1 Tax=Protopolystoma xenopodis TaxID=117903 RepID=A0A3S4ZM49_9PLAT|nr:unnamed protein product [Protopolystoma xenopodis]